MSSQIDGAATGVSSPWPTRTGVNRTELDPTSFDAVAACADARLDIEASEGTAIVRALDAAV